MSVLTVLVCGTQDWVQRSLRSGAAARADSILVAVSGVASIVAAAIGQLPRVPDWRGGLTARATILRLLGSESGRHFPARGPLDLGLVGAAVRAVGVLVVVVIAQQHLSALVVPLFRVLSSAALAMPNAGALTLDRHPDTAGSEAAAFGVIHYALGAITTPTAGLNQHSAIAPGATLVTAAMPAALARNLGRR